MSTHPMSETARFTWLIPFLGILSCLGPLSNDLYVPSLSLVEQSLGTAVGAAQLTMSSLLIGFSFGCLIHGPLSDKHGRKPILCLGLVIYVIGAVTSALSQSLESLVAARALQGLGGSAAMVLTRAIILDRWSGEQASRAMSWVAIFTFLTPVVAPIIGGYIASLGNWPVVFWSQAGAGVACLAVTAALLPRAHRTAAVGILAGLRAYRLIVTDGQALGYMLCTALAFIGLIAFVSNSSFVFVDFFGLERHEYGFCFSSVMAGASFGAFLNGRFVTRLGISRMIGLGSTCLSLGGVLALVFAWLGAGILPLIGAVMLYVFGIAFVFANAVARTMSRFRGNPGAASAVFGANQFLIGGIVAGILSLAGEPSPFPLTGSMAAAGIGCALVWWLWLSRAPITAGEAIG